MTLQSEPPVALLVMASLISQIATRQFFAEDALSSIVKSWLIASIILTLAILLWMADRFNAQLAMVAAVFHALCLVARAGVHSLKSKT